ncbi:hypothetical protein Tsubulata_035596 [Turnera subulata]|uniref:YTH domain-containing family protein n=1 Tax=Turnera subulata TaxID=218843 RepID=A0A9Q0GEC5_9ROSI|nr:hypothetical protein Tsubulata_035596 [Turnera subulata]
MANQTKLEKPESVPAGVAAGPVSKLADEKTAAGKDGIPSDLTSTVASSEDSTRTKGEGDATFTVKCETDQPTVAQPGFYGAPTNSYSYYYPGYSGPFAQLDEHGYFQPDASQAGMQPENGSMVYYMPGYNPYASGAVVGVDGQSVGQQPYFHTSGYIQHPVSYGSEAVPCYSWDSTYVGDVSNVNAGFGNGKSRPSSTAYSKSNGLNTTKTNGGNIGGKYSRPAYTQPVRPLNKVSPLGSDYSGGLSKGYQPIAKFSSFNGQKQGYFSHNGTINNRQNGQNGRMWWNGDYRSKPRDNFVRNNDFENTNELIRGPRAFNRNAPLNTASKKEDLGVMVNREQYNLPDFETEYVNAKFYVIKSYSEDDVHKSIKYDVWASTPNGNKKLDAAFRNAEEISSQTGKTCPIFLFFSVNRSGQFVGLAEMVGQVDFDKDMDFWQLDKWNGFFPVKWHVVKDIPNNQLRHIVLENNEGHPVTFSRDTQEIGLKQGLEMLNIFKTYSSKTSLLDDFSFYESREKSANSKKTNKLATLRMDLYENNGNSPDTPVNYEDGVINKQANSLPSLVNLTKNLSLNDYNPKSSSVKKIANAVPAVAAP